MRLKPDFTIYLPVERHLSKKNGRPLWRGRIGKSKDLLNAEKYFELAFKSKKNELKLQTLTGDLWVVFRFYFKNYHTKEGRRSERVNDLSNLYELPQDCLQSAGVIENDSDIVSHDWSRRLPGKENAIEIEIYKFNEFDRLPTQGLCPVCQRDMPPI
jgi:Holliday junction resolvase RusA-like endonuclease